MSTTATLRCRLLRVIVTATTALVGVVISVPVAAQAGPDRPTCAPELRLTSGDELSHAMAGMRIAGLNQRQIDKELADKYRLQLLTKRTDDVATTDDASIQAVSTGNDVSVSTPSIYRDTCSSRWYATASYNWLTMSRFRSEWPVVCGNPCALSGNDGFGISFSRNLSAVGGYSMLTWGTSSAFPASTGRTWPDTASTSGVWFEGVDHFKCCVDDYDFYHGQIVVTIVDPGCGPLQAVAKYSHTWSNVTITGVSIGYLAIGLSWSSGSNRWGRSGANSNPIYFC